MGTFLAMAALTFQVMLLGGAVVAGGCNDTRRSSVPAIFLFGDGALDVGNNQYLPSSEAGDPIRADHPFYGIDFPGGNATGRVSNGYTMADFIAKAMGLEMSPPAFLSLNNSLIEVDAGFSGINYASAYAVIWKDFRLIFPNTIQDDAESVSLPRQVRYFSNTVEELNGTVTEHELTELLSKSLFLISAGTSDLYRIANILDSPSPSPPPPDNETDIPHLVASYGELVVRPLHALGARRFGVVNAPPIGCAPAVTEQPHSHSPVGGCDDRMNALAREFNDGLGSLMAGLSSSLPGLRYSVADFYGFSNATFMNPSANGFTNTDAACCKGPCNEQFGAPCGNRREYWFWDVGHTTEKAAKLAAAAFYDGERQFTTPLNFKRLMGIHWR
ncbi:Os02g0292100 [Oryza sativa Japonica Group]|nr:Os02g0292100 [Oryza sativa Japonica Group]|eukprot:NP_001172907.1 Os02g0292100 [Oryza sativa Japonica Group]